MKYRRLDVGGDMQGYGVGGGVLEGADAVAACIKSRLLSFKGEWWETPDEGIPLEAMIGRMGEERAQIADALIRVRILDTFGVLYIESFNVATTGRQRVVNVTVMTSYGVSSVEVSV